MKIDKTISRKGFLRKMGVGAVSSTALLSGLTSCSDDGDPAPEVESCVTSPGETAGPFPIKSPADFVNENIVGDRVGVALRINFKIENISNNCAALAGVFVDVWQCDSKGNYSEYNEQLDGDFTSKHFLRGRQVTDDKGMVSFTSVYPGWYPGRAPHLHVEILNSSGASLLVTQTAFPEDISKAVYATQHYKGIFDTSNNSDGEFQDSLNQNLAESVTGDIANGYVLNETIRVKV
ncbi:MAG: intradiol ring-cleavage dioxygenase [Reichenbachiella sp.]|uniref:dioxygenase family protein n=1 Tax=Reichenbachiella sp. TaxID=2184521 RepID=UPI003265CE8B